MTVTHWGTNYVNDRSHVNVYFTYLLAGLLVIETETHVCWTSVVFKVKDSKEQSAKRRLAFCGKSTSELQDVTCYKSLHSATCHPTQMSAPHKPSQASWYSIYLPWRDGRLSWHKHILLMGVCNVPECGLQNCVMDGSRRPTWSVKYWEKKIIFCMHLIFANFVSSIKSWN